MERLKNLNKFWRSSALFPPPDAYSEKVSEDGEEVEVEEEAEEEEEESFFELELVMQSRCRSDTTTTTVENENESLPLSSKEGSNANQGRRVVPIEPDLKPQSPISILKSAPKFKVSLFKKTQTEQVSTARVACAKTDPDPKQKVEEAEEEAATISMLISENSSSGLKLQKKIIIDDPYLQTDSSKRFSKDVMQKYLKLKLIKPFHLRVAKRSPSLAKSKLFDLRECPSPAPSQPFDSTKLKSSSSPAGGFRVVCKQLGKSRSASSMGSVVVSVGAGRGDESLLERDDGIQSAILHCKRSFNSS